MFRFAIEAATKIEMTKWLKDFFAVAKAVSELVSSFYLWRTQNDVAVVDVL